MQLTSTRAALRDRWLSRFCPADVTACLRVAVAFLAIYTIWGSTYLAIRFAIETLPPLWMAGARNTIAGLLLYSWTRLRGAPRPTRFHWREAAIVGSLMLLAGNGGLTWAEQRVPSGLASLLIATVPLWMVVLEGIRPGRPRPTRRVWLGVAVGLAGVGWLIGPADLVGGQQIDPVGVAVLLFAALTWSLGSLYSRRARLPASVPLGMAMELLAGGALLLLAGGIAGEGARLDLGGTSLRSWLSLAYLILFGSLIGFTAYLWLLRHSSPARVSTYAYVNPVVAVFLGWAFAGEPLTWQTLVAAAVIVAGVALITSGSSQSRSVALSEAKSLAGVSTDPSLRSD